MINRILRANHRTKGKEIKPRRADIMKRSGAFVQAGKVEEKAREPENAIDGPAKEALQQAEAVGKRHGAREDPAVKSQK
jgi:hypothetical protein